MFRRLISLASFVLLLGLVGDAWAGDVVWKDTAADHLWSTPANWDLGRPPINSDRVILDALPGPTITKEGAVSGLILIGFNQPTGALTVDGGSLQTGTTSILIGRATQGTLNVNGGTINTGALMLGYAQKGNGLLNMNGGTITSSGALTLGVGATTIGQVNLKGGTISASSLVMRAVAGAIASMDVTGGTLILNGNAVATVQGYIDNGWITAYRGSGGALHLDYDVTNKGKTTLTATSVLHPNPADGAKLIPGAVELSWTPRDPCAPGQPVPVNVYFTDDLQALEQFLNPAAIRIVDKQSVTSIVVQTKPKTRYYWAVDCYVGDPNDPILGPVFSFVSDNVAPRVNAGPDIVTWLEQGVRTGNLDAIVTDEDAYTVQWSVVSEPNAGTAVIPTPIAEDTPVTFLAPGQYVLKLEASDGEYVGSDTVTIHVYRDRCEASRSRPGYQPLVGDLNGDCRVDDLDLALLQENWLKDNLLADDWFKMD